MFLVVEAFWKWRGAAWFPWKSPGPDTGRVVSKRDSVDRGKKRHRGRTNTVVLWLHGKVYTRWNQYTYSEIVNWPLEGQYFQTKLWYNANKIELNWIMLRYSRFYDCTVSVPPTIHPRKYKLFLGRHCTPLSKGCRVPYLIWNRLQSTIQILPTAKTYFSTV